jgi:hypothetical protein
MSSKRAIRRKACSGKVRYPTFTAARAAMKALSRNKPQYWPMNAYGCNFCGGFHFGHMPASAMRRKGGL